ncbi:hypothetical protein V6N13_075933 [Hibiscus sabdariffa]
MGKRKRRTKDIEDVVKSLRFQASNSRAGTLWACTSRFQHVRDPVGKFQAVCKTHTAIPFNNRIVAIGQSLADFCSRQNGIKVPRTAILNVLGWIFYLKTGKDIVLEQHPNNIQSIITNMLGSDYITSLEISPSPTKTGSSIVPMIKQMLNKLVM